MKRKLQCTLEEWAGYMYLIKDLVIIKLNDDIGFAPDVSNVDNNYCGLRYNEQLGFNINTQGAWYVSEEAMEYATKLEKLATIAKKLNKLYCVPEVEVKRQQTITILPVTLESCMSIGSLQRQLKEIVEEGWADKKDKLVIETKGGEHILIRNLTLNIPASSLDPKKEYKEAGLIISIKR